MANEINCENCDNKNDAITILNIKDEKGNNNIIIMLMIYPNYI